MKKRNKKTKQGFQTYFYALIKWHLIFFLSDFFSYQLGSRR